MNNYEKQLEIIIAIVRDTDVLRHKKARNLVAKTLRMLSDRLLDILDDEGDFLEAYKNAIASKSKY